MDSKEIDELIKEIALIIKGYSSLDENFKDITKLINAKRLLVGYSFRFSEVVGYALDEYNKGYNFRKRNTAESKLIFMKDGDTASKAELKSELKAYKFRVDEGESEALYRKVKSYFDTMRDAITSITQDISILRKEYEDSRIHN